MTKFLIDEDVNQKAIKSIPLNEKGFDVIYPQVSGYKGDIDLSIKKKANTEGRVLVTCDRDFSRFNHKPEHFPNGVLLLRRDPKQSEKRLDQVLKNFCDFALRAFPNDPYNFASSIYEIFIDRVEIQTSNGKEPTTYYYS